MHWPGLSIENDRLRMSDSSRFQDEQPSSKEQLVMKANRIWKDQPSYQSLSSGQAPLGLPPPHISLKRGETPIVFEAGPSVGAAVLQWGHIRLFSPWRYLIDREAAALLEADGWQAPDPEAYPTGRELVEHYLAPLANRLG